MNPPGQAQRPFLYEVVIGLVAPVGTDLERVQNFIRDHVRRHGYQPNVIHLSGLLADSELQARYGYALLDHPELERIQSHMNAGNLLRRETGRNDTLAVYAACKVLRDRALDAGTGEPIPRPATVHVLQSLKHPDEVNALRRIYGTGFFSVSVHCSPEERRAYLVDRKNLTEDQAMKVIERDEHEADDWGQRTREAFELGDIFLDYSPRDQSLSEAVGRAIDLIFGNPYVTPTQHEHGMFMAFAASLRSGSLSRHVGAAIATRDGCILATGANDVPKFGGGQYWPGAGDQRDLVRGFDSNDAEKVALAVRLLRALLPEATRDKDDRAVFETHETSLKAAGLLDITEYGRDVHAEMAAISACARAGASTRDTILYCTTLPCHNCAKHIVAAGIQKVYYVEPYPKSLAQRLHDDSVAVGSPAEDAKGGARVVFVPFVGVGPRRFFDLFSLRLGSGRPIDRKRDGKVLDKEGWCGKGPRVPMHYLSYIEREKLAADEIRPLLFESRPETGADR
ncbi:MAG: cytidine deaminase [Polyangiaceae bacterium]|nr:cytidine deaminase [Polyangiaceae bacterium]